MKYIVTETRRDGRGDSFDTEFATKNEAIEGAKMIWDHLTWREKKIITVYVLESVNEDEEAENHYDGNIVWQAGLTLYTADRETGTFIDRVDSVEEGMKLIEEYEAEDKAEGNYQPGFYAVVDEHHAEVDWKERKAERDSLAKRLSLSFKEKEVL